MRSKCNAPGASGAKHLHDDRLRLAFSHDTAPADLLRVLSSHVALSNKTANQAGVQTVMFLWITSPQKKVFKKYQRPLTQPRRAPRTHPPPLGCFPTATAAMHALPNTRP
jgi:hypothetical protein